MIVSKMGRTVVAVGLVASLLTAGVATSQRRDGRPSADVRERGGGVDHPHGPPPSPQRVFAEMDVNRDGMISRAEFSAFHAAHRMSRPGGPGSDRGPGGSGTRGGDRPPGPGSFSR